MAKHSQPLAALAVKHLLRIQRLARPHDRGLASSDDRDGVRPISLAGRFVLQADEFHLVVAGTQAHPTNEPGVHGPHLRPSSGAERLEDHLVRRLQFVDHVAAGILLLAQGSRHERLERGPRQEAAPLASRRPAVLRGPRALRWTILGGNFLAAALSRDLVTRILASLRSLRRLVDHPAAQSRLVLFRHRAGLRHGRRRLLHASKGPGLRRQAYGCHAVLSPQR
mmetsp:Transcript_11783/g.33944  ORF Transcript_11783/g.33944 Transcript_11783/m.33944 type:complete len:224 (+) Transcript_11783:1263-1934(+)